MVAGRPVEVDRLSGVAQHCGQSKLALLGVQSLESLLHALRSGNGLGVNARLLQNVSVVAKADRLLGVRETVYLAILLVGQLRVLGPLLVTQVNDVALPVLEITGAAAHKDVGHIPGLIVILQLALDIDSAAHGLDGDLSPGLLLIGLGQLLELSIDLDLTVYQAKRLAGRIVITG